jgi:hypothetical protein
MAWVQERTIQTERLPPIGEVSATFLRIEEYYVVGVADHLRP